MTVAAAIIAATVEDALAAVQGQPAVRRLADLAWSGGAMPIVVVSPDDAGRVAAALAGAPVTLAEPGPAGSGAGVWSGAGTESGGGGSGGASVRAILRGFDVAAGEVSGTDAIVVWPAGHVWVGPETVTSLIEAHGLAADTLILPTWRDQPGWPVLVPAAAIDQVRAMAPGMDAGEAIARLAAAGFGSWPLNLGDPGAVLDRSTARADLPPYEGPPGPVSGLAHEWGAAVADETDDAPPAGPSLAPYPQAADEDEG